MNLASAPSRTFRDDLAVMARVVEDENGGGGKGLALELADEDGWATCSPGPPLDGQSGEGKEGLGWYQIVRSTAEQCKHHNTAMVRSGLEKRKKGGGFSGGQTNDDIYPTSLRRLLNQSKPALRDIKNSHVFNNLQE